MRPGNYPLQFGGQNLKHVEVEGCIVNIRTNLRDRLGRKVTSIEILADDHYVGEQVWKLYGSINNKVVQLKKVRK